MKKQTEEYRREQEEKRRLYEQQKAKQERDDARISGMLTILIGNLVVIVIGLLLWFILRKLRMRKASIPEMQLSAPPKNNT